MARQDRPPHALRPGRARLRARDQKAARILGKAASGARRRGGARALTRRPRRPLPPQGGRGFPAGRSVLPSPLGRRWPRAARTDEGPGVVLQEVFANFAFSALITFGGANAEASPPIEAICRTKVAVIGLTGEDAGRKTVRNSGAIAPFMPAICIS